MMMRRALLPLAAVALLLVGCGDDEAPTTEAGSASTTAPAPANDTGGTTIEHAFGTTTLDAVPQRIVTLGSQWNGALLALGATPVAYGADPNAGDDGVFPWEEELLETSEPIEVPASGDLPLEAIAAQQPDLILVTFLVTDQAGYDDLAAIAPTIGALGERQVDTWQDLTTVAGQVLGLEDEAAAVIADVEGQVADLAAELPGLDGRTFALANYVPSDSIYVVTDEEDGSSLFFQALGLVLDPELVAAGGGAAGRSQLSLEQTSLLDVDVLVLFTSGADPSELPGYDQLPAVVDDAVAVLDYESVVALNTPSADSILHVLDLVRPALEAAAT
jgi:iron complex transport system substrate-binding protein